jgi:hypothetical protein
VCLGFVFTAAVIYQTSWGIYGFHQATGAHPSKFDPYATKFAGFVNGHPMGGTGKNPFVIAKVGAGSSYSMGHAGTLEHVQEAKAFASALNFNGPIYSFDLTHRWANVGVYVEARVTIGACKYLQINELSIMMQPIKTPSS